MPLFIEKWSPFIFAAIACVGWHFAYLTLPVDNSVLSAAITIGALFSAFIATYKGLLAATHVKVMKKLVETTYINDLFLYMIQAMWFSITLCIISFIGYFVDTKSTIYGLCWIFIITGTIISFIRLSLIMSRILRRGFSIDD